MLAVFKAIGRSCQRYASAGSLLNALPLCLAYLFGAYSFHNNIWPIRQLQAFNALMERAYERAVGIKYDGTKPQPRLITFPGKTQIPCPEQTGHTMVLLLIGQSMTSNDAAQRYTSAYGDRVELPSRLDSRRGRRCTSDLLKLNQVVNAICA
jgi:hypothetical protein